MSDAVAQPLRLYQDTYNEEGYASVTHLSKGLVEEPSLLSPVVTHLYYSSEQFGKKNFPLSFLTDGMNKRKKVNSYEYRYKVMGKPKKTSSIAVDIYSEGDQAGIGFSDFEIPFSDRFFMKSLIIYSPNPDIQARIVSDPVQRGDHYYYKCRLTTGDASAFVPVELLRAGTLWSRGIAKVGIEDSRGVEHRSYLPGEMRNQLSLVRDTYKIKGNADNKIMVVEIDTKEGTKKYFTEWELYLRQLEWKEKCETDLWYSRYNKDERGEIHDKDEDSGAVVPSGAGVLEQIPNEDTYSILTTEKLTQIIRDAFFNASDSMTRRLTVFTGTGGLEEVDKAMKQAASGYSFIENSDKFISGSPFNLTFGNYFKSYRHVDGHVVNFVHLPLMDNGGVAQASGQHPITGLPLESYNFYFLDMSVYDGEQNIQYVYEDGREETSFVVAGAKVPRGYVETQYRANDVDAASIQWMKSQGIAIKRPTNCFKLINSYANKG